MRNVLAGVGEGRGEVLWTGVIVAFLVSYPFIAFPAPRSEPGMLLPRVLALGLLAILTLLWRPTRAELRQPFPVLLGVHLVLVLVSSLARPDEDGWTFLLLGAVGRADGLLYQVGLAVAGVFFYRLLQRQPWARRIALWSLLAAGGLETALVLLQRFGFDPFGTVFFGAPYQLTAGSLGHPGIVAGLLLPLILIAAVLGLQREGLSRLLPYAALALFLAVGLSVTTNRSSFYSLLAGLILLVVLQRTPRTLVLALLLGFTAYGARLVLPDALGYGNALTETRTLETRVMIWRHAFDTIWKMPGQPLIGAGPDALRMTTLRTASFEELLPVYRVEYGWPEEAVVEDFRVLREADQPLRNTTLFGVLTLEEGPDIPFFYEVNIDKAHNFFLDRWLAFGLVDALLWLGLIAVAVWRGLRSREGPARAAAWGLVALAGYYQGWFPLVQLEPLHLVLIALVWASAVGGESPSRPEVPSPRAA